MIIRRLDQASTYNTPSSAGKTEKKESLQQQVKDQVSVGKQDDTPEAPKKWTIMHYSAADNDLKSYLVTDVNEMEQVGSTPNLNIIVQLDQGKDNCKRYYLTQDDNMREINSPVIKELGSTNMADPEALANFIENTMKKYPAEHYALIVSDHGYGWKGAVEDDSHKGWMTTPDIREGIEKAKLATGKKLDIIGFDACLMANTEVAYELKDTAKYMVASQQVEGANGWPYTPLLTPDKISQLDMALGARLNITPDEFAKKIVNTASNDSSTLPTMSAIDLEKMDHLKDASENLAQAIIETDTPNSTLLGIARQTLNFYGFKDQYHFAQLINESKDVKDEKLKEAAQGVMLAVDDSVFAEQHSSRYPNAHGLTVEIPTSSGVGAGYENLNFRKDTKWAEAMNKINGAGDPAPHPGKEKKKWTILHYGAGDNNLSTYINVDVNEMEKVGSNDTMNLVAQLDKGRGDCKRYYLLQDNDPVKINSPILKDLGETNMADKKVLADFIEFGIKEYPAEHYALIIGDHGGGWIGAVEDESHRGWMSMPDIREALTMAQEKTGEKLDIMGFDACMMATTEVGYELQDNATIMVASQENEGGEGWSYTPLLGAKLLSEVQTALRSRLNLSPEDFASRMVTQAEKDQASLPTLSAVDLRAMKEIGEAADSFADSILKTSTPNSVLKELARRAQNFNGLRDHYHFAQLVAESPDVKDEDLKKTAGGLMKSLKGSIIEEQHASRYPNAHGLTAEIPIYGKVGRGYTDLKFAKETKWDEAMNKINS